MDTEAEAIADLAGRACFAHQIQMTDGRKFLVIPDKASVRDISDEHDLKVDVPRYVKQVVTLQTQDSLVEYVNRYKTGDTVLFADISTNSILATVDYHAKDKAAHVAHQAMLTLPFSEEWGLWTRMSGKLVGQLEFARFIEENGADIRAPDAAELLEACRDLQAHRKVNFTKAVRTSSENETFEFTDESKATTKGGIELPTKFKLGIPVYFGEPDTEVFAFLRWAVDVDKGGLSLGIALHRAEHVRQAVFKQIVNDVAARTGCVAVFGKI